MMLMRENLQNSIAADTMNNFAASTSTPKSRPNVQDVSGHACPVCDRVYKLKSSLRNHQKWECGKDPQFKCEYCTYRAKQKMHMVRHMERMHRAINTAKDKQEITLVDMADNASKSN